MAGCGLSRAWLVRRNGARSAGSGSAEVATDGDDEESNFVIQTQRARPTVAIADNKTLSFPPALSFPRA